MRWALVVSILTTAAAPAAADAQERAFHLVTGGRTFAFEAPRPRGYAVVGADALERAGWRIRRGETFEMEIPGLPALSLRPDDPFLRVGEAWIQLVDAPLVANGRFMIPLQLFLDVLPTRFPGSFEFQDGILRRLDAPASDIPEAPTAIPEPSDLPPPVAPSLRRDEYVVVLDPGHGGSDPGALGPGGVREKDVALELAREVRAALRALAPDVEVHLTRETDELVPLWRRGEWATEMKGDRPGVFISLHANALPGDRAVRGFETYFLSEARTEHERRVAANENAPLAMETGPAATDDLDFILKELRNLDHAHWSALLAELVQERLAPVHPGPDRGVKQGPFAVITNALMPAVLIEVGFITNRREARLLADPGFRADAASAIAQAVTAFFQRYPPGSR